MQWSFLNQNCNIASLEWMIPNTPLGSTPLKLEYLGISKYSVWEFLEFYICFSDLHQAWVGNTVEHMQVCPKLGNTAKKRHCVDKLMGNNQ